MERKKFWSILETILENARAGILCTKDSSGATHMRWMTPALVGWREGSIFCFSIPGANKIGQIEHDNRVEWMIQTKDLREIVNIRGRVCIVDNPSLKAELMEMLGPRLLMFFKANIGSEDWVVLETVAEEGTYFVPVQGIKETVTLT